jgi:hypothetical protein
MHRGLADLKCNFMFQAGNTLYKSEADFMIFTLYTFLHSAYIQAQLLC